MSNEKPPALPKGFRLTKITDPEIIRTTLRRRWGESLMMFGRQWRLGDYQALAIIDTAGDIIGFATYATMKTTLLALTIDSFTTSPGVGKMLLAEISAIGRQQGLRALRVLTTNDNTPALRYFQMRGFRMVALYPGAIAVYRAITPTLPETGVDGIPVRDAIELEIDL